MKHTFKFLIAPAIICWCFFSIQGCKEPLIEDNNLLTTDDDLSIAKDTLHAKVFSVFEKPIASNGVTVGVLGTLTDVNFGSVQASFYAQCQLTTNNISFGTSPVLDSVVLTLKYGGKYGAFDQGVTVSVYELNQLLTDSTIYRTRDGFQLALPALGQVTNFIPKTAGTDSVRVSHGVLPASFRLRLSNSFGNKLLLADTNVLRNNASFKNLFKGLYVGTNASSTGNGLVYIDLSNALSGVAIYYSNSTADSLLYTFPLSGVKVNHFEHAYFGSPVYTSVNSPNINGEEKMYLQAGAGVNGKLFITDLDSLPKNIAINKAELVLSQINDTVYTSPLLLDLFRIDNAGQGQRLDDDGLAAFGGVRITENVNGVFINRYRFNIKKYFQKLLQGVYSNNGFLVQTLSPNINSERVIIGNSSTDKNYEVKLIVTYTKL